MHKSYDVCPLPVQVAVERIEGLLSKECVKYRTSDLSITSTKTPILIFNLDPRRFSRSNWAGVNPFAYVSGVDVRCHAGDNGLTRVIVCVNRFRTFFMGTFWVVWCLLLASIVPELWAKFIPIAFACVFWFGIVSFLGDYLIKKEIGDHLQAAEYQSRWLHAGSEVRFVVAVMEAEKESRVNSTCCWQPFGARSQNESP